MRTTERIAGLVAAAVVTASAIAGCTGNGSEPAPAAHPRTAAASASALPSPAAGPAAAVPAPARVGRPTRVQIPAIGVDERLHGVGLKDDGAMQTPAFGQAGWYDLGPRPGARGPAVIVAHVHGPAGDDVFADLADLDVGDRVKVRRTDGVSVFVVDAVENSKKDALPRQRIWNRTDQAVLRLITCGGKPDPVTRMYPENTVVYAHAVA